MQSNRWTRWAAALALILAVGLPGATLADDDSDSDRGRTFFKARLDGYQEVPAASTRSRRPLPRSTPPSAPPSPRRPRSHPSCARWSRTAVSTA